jgi:Fe-S oxidoreductase
MMQNNIKEIEKCKECFKCREVCDTFIVSEDESKSPSGRLKVAKEIFLGNRISDLDKISLYTCTLCGLCDLECTQEINISEIIHEAKKKLVEKREGPLEIHRKISDGILKSDNSVNGDPKSRLDWLPNQYKESESYENDDSNVLLFLGCMSSFKVKESALSSYELLKRANFDFKILKNEPCCGEYLYSSGDSLKAQKYFSKVYEIFKEINIEKIIVTCAGCLYAFTNVYPKYLDNFNIEVNHITQVLQDLERMGKLDFIKKKENIERTVIYHDACRMGRKIKNFDVYEEPRNLLKKVGVEFNELEKNRVNSICCGAGSGIRGVDKDLCINIGMKILEETDSSSLISSCPLCVFNFRYINYKKDLNKKIFYITDYINGD